MDSVITKIARLKASHPQNARDCHKGQSRDHAESGVPGVTSLRAVLELRLGNVLGSSWKESEECWAENSDQRG